MSKKVTVRALALLAGGALCFTAIPLSACGGGNSDSIVVMSEQFSGLFNPFYATSGADMDVVGMTQLSMLTTDSSGNIVAGEDEATAVLDYEVNNSGADAVYRFVLKNDLLFSDGIPLTMNDVMFNIYEYLDPVYTGSSTLYSTKIKGLKTYRTQSDQAGNTGDETESANSRTAYRYANNRRKELVDVFHDASDANKGTTGSEGNKSYYATPTQMEAEIKAHTPNRVYKEAIDGNTGTVDYNKQLLDDYNSVLKTFKEELNEDFLAARDAFDLETAPYKGHSEFKSDIFKFLFYEGIITPEYGEDPETHKTDMTVIKKFNNADIIESQKLKDQTSAVNYVYDRMIRGDFETVLTVTLTAGKIMTQYSSEAMRLILLGPNASGDDLAYPRVEGIVSLGHKVEDKYVLGDEVSSVKINGTDYKIAKDHKADGTPANPETYDILQVTLDGKDPKAIFNFAFAVAPAHYYSDRTVDIEHDKFGVSYLDARFQSDVIQKHNDLPVGAGPYKASDRNNNDDPSGSAFYNNNFIYYKANHNFQFEVKTEKFRYQYVSSANAIDKLRAKEIDFATPNFTKNNSDTLNKMEKNGFKKLYSWQLGYGYVGINAGKVTNLNVRKAIMSAMQAELATGFYEAGACEVIDWPMSNQSWAYPTLSNGNSRPNGHDYATWVKTAADPDGTQHALEKIRDYTLAAYNDGVRSLKYQFTIAGASISDHPTYEVFKQARDLLLKANDDYDLPIKWSIEIVADPQALTKLATGSLAIWAAAWGSTIDPDMYQVYHKDSKATSTYSWGYREIFNDTSSYEYGKIVELSSLIDEARTITDSDLETEQQKRAAIYQTAMGIVLDLAVEMPIYQRQNLYAYNANKLKGINEKPNPYTSPLEKIWEVEIIK